MGADAIGANGRAWIPRNSGETLEQVIARIGSGIREAARRVGVPPVRGVRIGQQARGFEWPDSPVVRNRTVAARPKAVTISTALAKTAPMAKRRSGSMPHPVAWRPRRGPAVIRRTMHS